METLYGRMQMADSSNQYNPFRPGQMMMDQPCTPLPSGACVSRFGHERKWVENPPPEHHPCMQKYDDRDVRGRGVIDPFRDAAYLDTVGTGLSDVSRGQMLLPSAYDMPIVRRVVFFDTRYRDVNAYPDAGNVTFQLDVPITSVSRIALVSARVPIAAGEQSANPTLSADDYVMLSVGLNLLDRVVPVNSPDVVATPPIPPAQQAFGRALAYVPLTPVVAGSSFAEVAPTAPPHVYYTDFLKPMPSIESVTLSWHIFAKSMTQTTNYVITPPMIPPEESLYDPDKNATVMLVFYCKNRRPE